MNERNNEVARGGGNKRHNPFGTALCCAIRAGGNLRVGTARNTLSAQNKLEVVINRPIRMGKPPRVCLVVKSNNRAFVS